MVTIPRYQQRTSVPVGGQEYRQAFGPGWGPGMRQVGNGLQVVGQIVSMAQGAGGGGGGGSARGDVAGAVSSAGQGVGSAFAGFSADALNQAQGAEAAYGSGVGALLNQAWMAVGAPSRPGPEPTPVRNAPSTASLMSGLADIRKAAVRGLSPEGSQAFAALSARRDAGILQEVRAISAAGGQLAQHQASVHRENLSLMEFVRQAEVDESAAHAALASAIDERSRRLAAEGVDESGLSAARRDLLATAQAVRVRQAIGIDPARAEAVLDQIGGVLPEESARALSMAISAERIRREARSLAAGLNPWRADGMEESPDSLVDQAERLAGGDPARAAALRGAALGVWRAARAQREAVEDAAWREVAPFLAQDTTLAWTDLPGHVWGALSDRQRATVSALLEMPERESDPVVLAHLKDIAAKDPEQFRALDLGALGPALDAGDHTAWRGLQDEARRNSDAWKGVRAYLGQAGRAVQASMPAGVDEDARLALQARFHGVIAEAEALKGGRLSWDEMLAACLQGVASPQANPSERDIELNRRLWTSTVSVDGLYLDPTTGRIFRWVDQSTRSGTRRVKVLATDAEVEEGRARRQDALKMSVPLGRFSETPGSWVLTFGDLPVSTERQRSKIDWQFVGAQEESSGVSNRKAHVPTERKTGRAIDESGVTVGLGIDLGAHSEDSLRTLGAPDYLIQRLSPYLGKKKQDAIDELKRRPLVLSEREVALLDRLVHDSMLADLVRKFDKDSKIGDFYSLPPGAQTVLMSVFLQYGPNTPTRVEKFWGMMTSGDGEAAVKELRNFRDRYDKRRKKEADVLEAEVLAGRFKLAPEPRK